MKILHTADWHLGASLNNVKRYHEFNAMLDFLLDLIRKKQIPCVIVAGTAKQNGSEEPHAWNYVQMEDGLYYAVDLTWNDDGELASTDYFLVGAETVPAPGRAPFIE